MHALSFLRIGAVAALINLFAAPGFAQLTELQGVPNSAFFSLAVRGDTILAGADNTVYVSMDKGETWAATNAVDDDAVSVDAIIATDAGWFAGCFDRGVYRSTDRGETWSSLNNGLVGIGARNVTDFEAWGTRLYASTEGAGVFELDLLNPAAWQLFGNEFAENEAETVVALAMMDDRIYAAAGGNGLVFTRSLAAGGWSASQLVGQLFSVARTGIGLVAASHRRAWASVDGGETWQETGAVATPGLGSAIATADPADPGNQAYLAIAVDAGMSQLYRTGNVNDAWEWLGTIPETLEMAVLDGRIYMAQSDGLRYWPLNPTTSVELEVPVSERTRIATPSPHPVVGRAEFGYWVGQPGMVRLDIFDSLGRRVAAREEYATGGEGVLHFDAGGLPAGPYVARLTRASNVAVQSFLVLK